MFPGLAVVKQREHAGCGLANCSIMEPYQGGLCAAMNVISVTC